MTRTAGLTDLDRTLLVAAVASDHPGLSVVQAWSGLARALNAPGAIERFCGPRQDLIGLLHRTARAAGAEGELAARLAGGHRRTWLANQLRLSAIKPALEALSRVCHPLVTDDLAMIGRLGDVGARPLQRLRVLIPASDFGRAQAPLLEMDWRLQTPHRGQYIADPRTVTFQDGAGNRLDLARCVGIELAELKAGARVSHPPGAPALSCPSRSALLAGLIADSSGWLPRPALLRLADVALLFAGLSADQWSAAVTQLSAQHEISAASARVLSLSTLIPGAVPEHVLRSLASPPATRADRLAHRLDGLAPSLARHLRQTADGGVTTVVQALPASLRTSWSLSATWQIAPVAVARVADRAIRRPSQRMIEWHSASGAPKTRRDRYLIRTP